MVGGNFESAKGASPLGGVGVCSPRTFWNLKNLKNTILQHSQADSYVKKGSQKLIVIFFLSLTKSALSSPVIYFNIW